MERLFLFILHMVDKATILVLYALLLLPAHGNALFHVPLFWRHVVVNNKCFKFFWQESEDQVKKGTQTWAPGPVASA